MHPTKKLINYFTLLIGQTNEILLLIEKISIHLLILFLNIVHLEREREREVGGGSNA